jgi:hypothetical protein
MNLPTVVFLRTGLWREGKNTDHVQENVLTKTFNLRGSVAGSQMKLFMDEVRQVYCSRCLNYWGDKIKEQIYMSYVTCS